MVPQLQAPRVGWFYLSNEEAARAREFLRLCNGDDAVDELGFGILRDGFSEQFFPGTSTVMTEPRYLIFIPAIFRWMERALEKRKSAIKDPEQRSLDMQDQLRDVLSVSYGGVRGHGVIGISKKELLRYPSSIYWAALRTLGILLLDNASEGDYLKYLQRHHELSRVDDNNGDPVAEAPPRPINWHRHFVYHDTGYPIMDAEGRFLNGLKFELTSEEALYLRDCYSGADGASQPAASIRDSLLAALIDKRRKAHFAYPWDVKPPPKLAEAIDDAQHFSALARGATLQYYHWLIEARRAERWEVPKVDIELQFERWWERGRPLLLDWEESGFLKRRNMDIRPYRGDADFLKTWLRHCREAHTATTFLRNAEVRQLILNRERVCKPKKARLVYKKHLQTWDRKLPDSQGAYQLDFRAGIGWRFVDRIVAGLEGDASRAKDRST